MQPVESRVRRLLCLAAASQILLALQAQPPAGSIDPSRLGLLHEASTILSHKLIDSKHRKLGKVENVVVDLESGRALAVLVSARSGLVGVPAPLVAIVSAKGLELRIEGDAVARAPSLGMTGDAAPSISDLERCFAHFGQELPAVGHPCLVSRLLSSRLNNSAGQSLATVKDAMLDLPVGKAVYLVVDAGQPDYLYPVPAVCVAFDGVQTQLRLDRNRDWLAAGPHFDRSFWAQMALPDLASSVQDYYAVSVAAPVRLTLGAPAPAASQAAPRSDNDLTQAVLAEIYKNPREFANLNLVVTTVNGRVTLSGTVRNEAQKRNVISAAQRVAGPTGVIDKLQFRGKVRTASL